MTDQPMDPQLRSRLRSIPSVSAVLAEPPVAEAASALGAPEVTRAVRAALDDERARVRAGGEPRALGALAADSVRRARRASLPSLRRAVNATGVVVHTNLGRAPLARAAVERLVDVASGYSTLEYSVEACARGDRRAHAAEALRRLTGAPEALVVNNNASAVLLVLSALAAGREVIISRGELVEIGGSFRIPDVMGLSGCRLVEVGTTNRTHLRDYERAITGDTALILKVHPSNYRVEGFHEEVPCKELAELAHGHDIMLYEDQGSGALVPDALFRQGGERLAQEPLREGADVVSCSGDKLLGASQAGIILGSAETVSACGSHPLMRAVRPDKLTLAALEATLDIYLRGEEEARSQVPVLSMLFASPGELRERAEHLAASMTAALEEAGAAGAADVSVAQGASAPGGGSLPTTELPTYVVRVVPAGMSAGVLHRALVQAPGTPVVTRVADGAVLFDVRTLGRPSDGDLCVKTLVRCLKEDSADAE